MEARSWGEFELLADLNQQVHRVNGRHNPLVVSRNRAGFFWNRWNGSRIIVLPPTNSTVFCAASTLVAPVQKTLGRSPTRDLDPGMFLNHLVSLATCPRRWQLFARQDGPILEMQSGFERDNGLSVFILRISPQDQRIRPSESVDVHEFREISLSKDRRPRQHVPLESLLIVGEKVCLRSMWTGKPMVSPVPRWRRGPKLYGKMALA